MTLSWRIGKKQAGQKAGDFLKRYLPDRSGKALKRAIDKGALRINGKVERFSSTTIREKDWIEFNPPPPEEKIAFDPSQVLFADDHLLLYHKPAGVACDEKEVLALLKPHYPQARLIHRLDKETSGVLLLALNAAAQEKMEDAFKERKVKKIYWAVVSGHPESAQGIIRNRLGKIASFSGQSLYGAVKAGGLEASTHWKVLKRGKFSSLVECQPETGRTHQIRVHLAEMGHPILGDLLYGRETSFKKGKTRMMLHALALSFDHPVTGKSMVVEAAIDASFKEALKDS